MLCGRLLHKCARLVFTQKPPLAAIVARQALSSACHVCRQRGSVRDGTGTHDTIVNQLLTKIDGVDALNNILLIGMTNRKVSCMHCCGPQVHWWGRTHVLGKCSV